MGELVAKIVEGELKTLADDAGVGDGLRNVGEALHGAETSGVVG